MKNPHLARMIIEIVAFPVLIFLAIHFTMQSYNVTGATNMEPGLVNNQDIMVNKVAYLFHNPEHGDVIVFHNPQSPSEDLMKRVIGIPGDTVVTDSSHVWINNVLLNEPYISKPINTVAGSWHLQANEYFVLGDNRPLSFDSRYIGPIPRDYIVGKAVLVFWPLSSIHLIDTHSDVFSHI